MIGRRSTNGDVRRASEHAILRPAPGLKGLKTAPLGPFSMTDLISLLNRAQRCKLQGRKPHVKVIKGHEKGEADRF